jgi:hypothetical protein
MARVGQANDFIYGKYSEIRQKYPDLVLLTFLISTGLIFFQHSQGWSWDFNVYSLIGSYIFHDGIYMEWLRPPLASTLMGLLQYLTPRKIAEYIFIAINSSAFLLASRELAESFEVDFKSFYVFLLTPAAIFFATMAGTEMLTMAFVMMFLAEFERPRSGIWLGLSFLTRYNFAVIIPLVLLQRKPEKIVKTGLISGLTLMPWLAYNFFMTGNPLTSFGNFLMLNVFLRYAATPLDPQNLFIITLPAAAVLMAYLKPEIREKVDLTRQDSLMLGFAALTGLSYFTADYRSLRYLYPMILPVAFYAARARRHIDSERILYAFVAVNLIGGAIWVSQADLTPSGKYMEAADAVEECMAESESWVMTNYAGAPTKPVSSTEITFQRLEEGYRSISFKSDEYRNISAPVIYETERFTIYGYQGLCKKPVKADETYLSGFNQRTGLNYTFRGYIYNRFVKEKIEALRG